MPAPTYSSSTTLAGRPPSSSSSSYRSYVPRKPSPLAEGASTSPPSSSSSSVVLASPNPSPPDSPKSLSFVEMTAPSMLCPKPTYSKSLPTRVQTVHRPATAPYSPNPTSGLPPPVPASPHPHRRIQSTSSPILVSGAIEENPRQVSVPATEPETRRALRPVRPSTSRVPEENWMTSESAPRFTRQSLVLGTVVLPVRKHDVQQAKRQSALKYGTPIRYSTIPHTATHTTSNVTRSSSSSETVVVEKKDPYKIPSVQVVDVDGAIQAVDEVGVVVAVDLSKRDGAGTKKSASLGHVRKFSRDFAAKMKIRSGQVKPIVAVIQEKGPDPGLTQKLTVEKEESGSDPRPSGAPLRRARTILGHILGI